MKRSKKLIQIMCISILLSGAIIFMCESTYFSCIRIFIKQNIIFFNGKKNVIENICIGIFASSIIALIGYILEYKNEKSIMKLKIIRVFKIVYFEYYKSIGIDNIKDIREKFMKDEIISEISYCDIEYDKILNKKDDMYMTAIKIMKWTEMYYTNMFCIYAALCEIQESINSINNKMEEQKKWEEIWKKKWEEICGRQWEEKAEEEYLRNSQESLSILQKCYDDILEEMNKRLKENLEIKRKKDCNEMVDIKNKFGILDDQAAAFLGNISYIQEVWQDIGK